MIEQRRRRLVTGCVVGGCQLEPSWLVSGFLHAGPSGQQSEAWVPVCQLHLVLFGLEVAPAEGDPIRYLTHFPPARLEFMLRPPIHIRTVQDVTEEDTQT